MPFPVIQLCACGPRLIVLRNKRLSGLARRPVGYLTGLCQSHSVPVLRLSPFHPYLLIRLPFSRPSHRSFPRHMFSRTDVSIFARHATIGTPRFLTSGCAGLCCRLTDEMETVAASVSASLSVCHTHAHAQTISCPSHIQRPSRSGNTYANTLIRKINNSWG